MSSFFGANNNSFFFGNASSGVNSFFGGTNLLGDYAMIKSGVYKKLLKSYYSEDSSNKKSSSSSTSSNKTDSTSKTDSAETTRLLSVKTDASELQSAVGALKDRSLYEVKGQDEEGKDVYKRDEIKKAVKNFVSAYNSFLDSTSKVDSTKVLKRSVSVVKETSMNQNLLKKAGITIGADNKLSIDEEKLNEANMSTLTSLFTGSGSYADQIMRKASETYSIANSATYTGNHYASSYTYGGAYAVMGKASTSLDKYL